MLLHLRIHVIPRLRSGGEYIHYGLVGRWIVQAPRLQSEGIWPPFQHQGYLAAAIWAKPALDRFAALPNNFVVTRLAANLNSAFRHHNDSRVSAAARLLAVPTVTVDHDDWISIALVTDGATSAPA
jgi:hypothetical protein